MAKIGKGIKREEGEGEGEIHLENDPSLFLGRNKGKLMHKCWN